MRQRKKKTQIVVVGGGAGGSELITRLGRRFGRDARFDILLVEQNRTHVWKPLLHEVAAGALDANLDEVGYGSHANRWGYRFFLGTLEDIDRETGHVVIAPMMDIDGTELLGRHRIRYDYGAHGDRGPVGPRRLALAVPHAPAIDSRLRSRPADDPGRPSQPGGASETEVALENALLSR